VTALVDDPAVFVERIALGGDGARVGV